VAGDILYRFGRQAGPGNTTLRWNGIGIAAPVGSPVRAVSQGTVERAERFGTYGLCVVLDHGGGFYSLYCQLEQATVRRGQGVSRGEVIGTSGGANSDEGPHLHFEIRSPSGPGGQPQAVDPITWLRRRQ
jgi:septal ring factor EnvC (AmiA/AmiB activator)